VDVAGCGRNGKPFMRGVGFVLFEWRERECEREWV